MYATVVPGIEDQTATGVVDGSKALDGAMLVRRIEPTAIAIDGGARATQRWRMSMGAEHVDGGVGIGAGYALVITAVDREGTLMHVEVCAMGLDGISE